MDSLAHPDLSVGTLQDPVNIAIMDVVQFIHDHRALPVSSALIMEPSTNNFHSEGLYSETIFGSVGSPERMERFGYIDLRCQIFHPKIFKLITQLGGLYKDIMAGKVYAVFDPVSKNFERVLDDPLLTPSADTGYSFFLRHFHELNFSTTDSNKRDERIAVIEKYKARALVGQHLVEPAGLRDISNDSSGRLIQDDVNKLYVSLLLYTRSIPKGSQSIAHDPVRYQIQSKVQEIYEYIENFLDGKYGFIQGNFARRKLALGTRNVITAYPGMAASPEDPQFLKTDDVAVGVYQTIKGLQPYTKFGWKTIFGNPIFKPEMTAKIALSDPKTGQLVYTQITPDTWDKWMSGDGLDKIINSFRNIDLRSKPILIPSTDGKDYALSLVYDEGDEIAICRSIDDLKARWPRPVQKNRLRPITYIEVFYLIAETMSAGKHAFITRYPVIEQGSIYPANIHVMTTTPARHVQLIDLLSGHLEPVSLKQYPIIQEAGKTTTYMDAAMVHPSKLAGLGADHDGDKASFDMVLCRDSNEECRKYLESPRSVLNTDMRFITGGSNYLVDLMLHALTHE